ncbi:MAG: amino acid ABC transporter permease [Betaproteobacteria bacterium]
MNLDFSWVDAHLVTGFLLKGIGFSIELTLVAMLGGIAIGTLLALMRLSGHRALSLVATFYVDALRSIPLVMVILWFFLLVPLVTGHPMGAATSALITFTVFEAAYYAEIMRAGISSIPRGQAFAGYAMGMSYAQCMGLVVLPQALRNMLPLLLTQTVILFQDTSLVYAIGAYDLLKGFEVAGRNFNRPVESFLLAAALYFGICFGLSMLVRRLQRRIRIHR